MNQRASEIFDNGMAHLQSAVSQTPGLGPWVMDCDSPSFAPSWVHVLEQSADTIPQSDWVPLEGEPKSGPLPRWYRSVGVLEVDAAMLDEKVHELRESAITAYHATAYRIGNRIMAQTMKNRPRFDAPVNGSHLVAPRRGKAPVEVTAGVLDMQNRRLHVFGGSVSFRGYERIEDVRPPILII